MPGKAARKPDEERHVGRCLLPVFVFGVAVGIVHSDADDLFGVGHWDGQCHLIKAKLWPCRLRQGGKRPGLNRGAHGGEVSGQIGDAVPVQMAPTAHPPRRIADKLAHGAMIGWALSAASFGSRPLNSEPCSNQLRGAGAPQSVWRWGSFRSHLIGSRSGSTV